MKFFREVQSELKKVSWPTRAETTTTTLMVLIFAILASLFFMGADWIIINVARILFGFGG